MHGPPRRAARPPCIASILGLDRRENERADKRLFSYAHVKGEPVETQHGKLSPYLFDAGGLKDPHLVVREESRPINGLERIVIGSKPIDGGHFIFSAEEREAFLAKEPAGGTFDATLHRRARVLAGW